MNLLLDTHVALWAITDNPKLSQKARELIMSPRNNVWVSAANIWEIAVKHALGKGDMPISVQDAMRYFKEARYRR
ncbi:MAG: type II toxin-antitoxin system VapC family toxin [Methylococcales bacterium]